jgi:hypothetical protein
MLFLAPITSFLMAKVKVLDTASFSISPFSPLKKGLLAF